MCVRMRHARPAGMTSTCECQLEGSTQVAPNTLRSCGSRRRRRAAAAGYGST
jgi:hypothetical protein